MPFMAQMANVGSEVERALKRRESGEEKSCMLAFDRALELLDLTISDERNLVHIGELTRAREVLADNIVGGNLYATTDESWRKYFGYFAQATRRNT